MLSIEVETHHALSRLRGMRRIRFDDGRVDAAVGELLVEQIQVNVIKKKTR